jgi:hypothetical protein
MRGELRRFTSAAIFNVFSEMLKGITADEVGTLFKNMKA